MLISWPLVLARQRRASMDARRCPAVFTAGTNQSGCVRPLSPVPQPPAHPPYARSAKRPRNEQNICSFRGIMHVGTVLSHCLQCGHAMMMGPVLSLAHLPTCTVCTGAMKQAHQCAGFVASHACTSLVMALCRLCSLTLVDSPCTQPLHERLQKKHRMCFFCSSFISKEVKSMYRFIILCKDIHTLQEPQCSQCDSWL